MLINKKKFKVPHKPRVKANYRQKKSDSLKKQAKGIQQKIAILNVKRKQNFKIQVIDDESSSEYDSRDEECQKLKKVKEEEKVEEEVVIGPSK